MAQINYDGNGFYIIDPVTKEREPIPVDSLPEEFDPGEGVSFDYNDGLIFHKPVTRDQFVAECQRAYDKSKRPIPAQGNTFNLIVDKTPVKSLDNL